MPVPFRSISVILLFLLTLAPAWSAEVSDLDDFFRAVTDGRSERVSDLLKGHPDWVDRELFLGIRPLYRASVLGRSEVTQILLESGADVGATTDRGNLPLHAASQNGHLGVTLLLLASKAPVNAQNEAGTTALHLAARCKRLKILKELLKNGADVNVVDQVGRTPLHFAAGLGRMDLVEPLVEAGADMNVVDQAGYSPLGWARTAKRNSFGDVGGYLDARGAKDIRPDPKSQ